MLFTSVVICFLLFDHQNSVYSYNRQNHRRRAPYELAGNDIVCNEGGVCDRNPRHSRANSDRQYALQYRRQPQTQPQIDCDGDDDNDNCQPIESQSKPQPQQPPQQLPNDCHNQLDCKPNHSRRSHRQRHNQREIQPQTTPEIVPMNALQSWRCEFSANDCGIQNQHNMLSYFKLIPDSMGPVFGKSGVLYLDLATARSAGARLITPYFPANGCRYGCLTIEYMLCGNGIDSLYLIQQDVRNYCVWQKSDDRSYRWSTASLTVDLSRSDPRFFIELRFNPNAGANGFAAISHMAFKYGECDQNDANECDLNQFIGTLL